MRFRTVVQVAAKPHRTAPGGGGGSSPGQMDFSIATNSALLALLEDA